MSEFRERLEVDYRGTLTKLGDELTRKSVQRLVFLFPKITRAEASELEHMRYDNATSEFFRILEDNKYLSLTNVDGLTNALQKISLMKAATILENYKRRNENLINAELQRQYDEENRRKASDSAGSSASNSPIKFARNAQNEAKKKIFVSFSFEILERVTKLKDRIEKHIGKDSCWICTEEIRGGDTMYRKIAQAIEDADIILCMVNKDFINSKPCEEEVLLCSAKDKHIIPILLEKMDLRNLKKRNGEPSSMQLPLAQLLYINMYDQTKKEDEFKKLITTIQEQLLTLREQGDVTQSGNPSRLGTKRCSDGDPCTSSQKKNKTD